MSKVKTAFAINILIFALELIALGWMLWGIAGPDAPLSDTGLRMLKYFTVDSNILLCIAAFISACDGFMVIKGAKAAPSRIVMMIKHAATVGVTLTMLVTVFFLAPVNIKGSGYFALFADFNFFMHFLNPLLSLIVFLCFEKSSKNGFLCTFTGIIPMAVYAVYYIAVTFAHVEGGVIQRGYDWYGFLMFGVNSVFVVIPLIFIVTYIISFILWKLNRAGA